MTIADLVNMVPVLFRDTPVNKLASMPIIRSRIPEDFHPLIDSISVPVAQVDWNDVLGQVIVSQLAEQGKTVQEADLTQVVICGSCGGTHMQGSLCGTCGN